MARFQISKVELFLTLLCLIVVIAVPPVGVLIAFLLVLFYLLIGEERKRKVHSIGLRAPADWISTIGICLALGISIEMGFQLVFNPLIEELTGSKVDLTAYDGIRGNFTNYLLLLLIGWVVGGFIEEILFRGFLITRLSRIVKKEQLGNWFAILLTSLTFGFSHLYQGWSGVISTSLMGLIFGFIFIRSNKLLWYTIVTHGFINTTALTLMWLDLDKVLGSLLFK